MKYKLGFKISPEDMICLFLATMLYLSSNSSLDCSLSRVWNSFCLLKLFPKLWQCFSNIMDTLQCIIHTRTAVRRADLYPQKRIVRNMIG